MQVPTGVQPVATLGPQETRACEALNRVCRLWADRYRPSRAIDIPKRLRKWPYGHIGPYNGFTGEERVVGWQVMKYLQQKHLLPRPSAFD